MVKKNNGSDGNPADQKRQGSFDPRDVGIPESLHELGHEWHFFPHLATEFGNNQLKELWKHVESIPSVRFWLFRSA